MVEVTREKSGKLLVDTQEFMDVVVWNEEAGEFVLVKKWQSGTSRWSYYEDVVVKHQETGELYITTLEWPATESQEVYRPDKITLVPAEEFTTVSYREKKSQ